MRWQVDPHDSKRVIGESGATVCYADTYMIAAQIVRDHRQFWEERKAGEMDGAQLIAAERERQIRVEGWTPAHDAGHVSAELTNAACAYAETAAMQMYRDGPEFAIECPPDCWPFHAEYWKPSPDPIRNLQKAGALIAAEIDRLQRELERQRAYR